MKLYIVIEHPEFAGGSPKSMTDVVLGAFFDQRRAEDFVSGIVSYIRSHEGLEATLRAGKAQTPDGDIYFEIVEVDAV